MMESWVQHHMNINAMFLWRFVRCRSRSQHNGEQDRENDFTDFFVAEEVFCPWARYWALTLVKQTGLQGSDMLGQGTDCLV